MYIMILLLLLILLYIRTRHTSAFSASLMSESETALNKQSNHVSSVLDVKSFTFSHSQFSCLLRVVKNRYSCCFVRYSSR